MHFPLPEGINGRFTLLLIAALLLFNLAAAFLLAREGTEFDKAIRVQRDMGRLVSLVESIEESDRATGEAILSRTETGYTRFSIDPAPLGMADVPQLLPIAAEIRQALPDHEIRVIPGNPVTGLKERGPALMIISVRLDRGTRDGEWLNSLVYPLTMSSVWRQKWFFFLPLFASTVVALVVGLSFLNQLTMPLKRLALASHAAGRGDHSVRLAETGAREIREAAIAFNTMQQEISEFEARRRQLLASVGHDLRTPITGLRLRAEGIEDAELREAMIRSLNEMTLMTEDILRFSQETAFTEEPQQTELADFLAEICEAHDLPFTTRSQASLPLRPVAMRRAVCNLIENALRYTGEAAVTLTQQGNSAVIRVTDHGPGIPEAMLKAVQEPFIRGETSRCRETGGSGLGLAIARAIVNGHGGRLILTNLPGGGLEAAIELPLAGRSARG